jgi:Ser/Thr protein kinase RdoA (MazF antagonist)
VDAHLQHKGFPAPAPLGLDEAGREIVSWLPGRAANWPWPPALLATDGARAIGALLRAYHAAVADFVPPTPPVWRHGPQPIGPGEIALHGDFLPHNLIWSPHELTGVIDFELARPGAPLEDAGYAVVVAAQLRPDAATRPPGFDTPPDRRARLAAFAEGYGLDRAALVEAALKAQREAIDRTARLAAAGLQPWVTFRDRGLAATMRAELAWTETNAGRLA